MREVDSEAPVVWPSWCYAGGGNVDQGGGGGATVKVRNHRRRGPSSSNHISNNGPPLDIASQNNNNINNNNNLGSPLHAAGIKSESSLSPHYNTPEWSSSRSRSVTPSSCSFPGTPPQSGADRGPSPAHPGQPGSMSNQPSGTQPIQGPSLGHNNSLQAPHALRNYSDFMRSLAAKYNNSTNNNNEYFRTSLPNGLDHLAALKPPSLGTLLPPHPINPPQPPAPPPQIPVGGLFANYSFSQGGPKTVSAFPSMVDMSSTKALLAIVRVANVTKDAERNSKGVKRSPHRDSNSVSSPLDLSSAASIFPTTAVKRLKTKLSSSDSLNESTSFSGSLSGGERERSPGVEMRNLSIRSETRNGSLEKLNFSRSDADSPASGSSGRKSPGSTGRKSPGSSSGRECSSSNCCRIDRKECTVGANEVASWNVDDVCKFVEGIDICSEYSLMFREQSIDGAGLPLLTEDHLTGLLKMKLGPALKLKALLAAKMNGCSHCQSHHQTSGISYLSKSGRPPSVASNDS